MILSRYIHRQIMSVFGIIGKNIANGQQSSSFLCELQYKYRGTRDKHNKT